MSDINYFTKEGYEKIEEELRDLKTRGRKEIADEIAEARSKGDLSENAEYDAAKEAQGFLEDKIVKLENILANARIVEPGDLDLSQVRILTKVTILNKNVGKEMTYQLVSPKEADFKENKISVKSPIGAALIGKKVGEIVNVKVPAGTLELKVLKIEI